MSMRSLRLLLTIGFIAISAMVRGVAQAPSPTGTPTGTLRGRVDIQRVINSREPRPGVAELTGIRPADSRDFRPAVVFLESTDVADGSTLRTADAARSRSVDPSSADAD